jgi:prolipoprotein diacylglyceryltransferase
MSFPVVFHIAGRAVPAHLVFELLAYAGAFQIYLLLRRREKPEWAATISPETHVWLIAGAILGALFGAKLLAVIESFPDYWHARADPRVWLQGKTIVGGLLGGWIGVEIAKKMSGLRGSSGDAYTFPLIFGIAVGRIGCFLTGLPDHTYGDHTTVPWAVDFGDGPRHPTQLYEIAALILIAAVIAMRSRRPHTRGELFRLFLLLYLLFRFAVEFIKPTFRPYLGLSAIQVASAIGVIVCAASLIRISNRRELPQPCPT